MRFACQSLDLLWQPAVCCLLVFQVLVKKHRESGASYLGSDRVWIRAQGLLQLHSGVLSSIHQTAGFTTRCRFCSEVLLVLERNGESWL